MEPLDKLVVLAVTRAEKGVCPMHGQTCPQLAFVTGDPEAPSDKATYIEHPNPEFIKYNKRALYWTGKCLAAFLQDKTQSSTGSPYTHCELYYPDHDTSFSVSTNRDTAFQVQSKTFRSPNNNWEFYGLEVTASEYDTMFARSLACIGAPYDESTIKWFMLKSRFRRLTDFFGCTGDVVSADFEIDGNINYTEDYSQDMAPITCARLCAKPLIAADLLQCTNLELVTTREILECFRFHGAKRLKALPVKEARTFVKSEPSDVVKKSMEATRSLVKQHNDQREKYIVTHADAYPLVSEPETIVFEPSVVRGLPKGRQLE